MSHIHRPPFLHFTPSDQPDNQGDRIATRGLMLIFAILSLGIFLGGAFYYRYYERHFRSEVEHQLSAIAELKVSELVQWRKERLADAGVLYQNTSFAVWVQRFFENPEDADARRQILVWLEKYKAHYQYDRVFLLDARGDERLAVPGKSETLADHLKQDAAQCLDSGQVTFLDFHRDSLDGPVHLSLLVPILGASGGIRPIGILVLRIDPGIYLYSVLSQWPTPSRTAETLLVRQDGNDVLFLNEFKFQVNSALNLRRPLETTAMPAVKAVLGQEGIVEGLDYRGVPVTAALRAVPNSPWFLIARMDTAEVTAPLRERLWLTVLFAGFLFLISGASLCLVWRRQRAHFYLAGYVAKRERAWLQDVIARSLNEIYVFDPQTLRFRFVNTGACRNIGYSMAELSGLTPLDINSGFTEEAFHDILQPLVTGEREKIVFETNHRRKDGSEYPAEIHLQLVQNDEGGIFLAVINDTSERRQAEEILRARLKLMQFGVGHSLDELLRQALDEVGALTDSPVGFYHFVEADQKTLSLQAWSTRTMQEFCKAEGKGLHYGIDKAGVWVDCIRLRRAVVHNDYASLPDRKGLPPGHAPVVRELVVPIFRQDRIVAVLGVGNKPQDYTEKDVEIVTFMADVAWEVAERKRAEETLQNNERELQHRNDELTRFMYTVSHDLKSPLVTIQSFLGYLEQDMRKMDTRQVERDLTFIRNATEKMEQLFNELLRLTRVGRVVSHSVKSPLQSIVQEALDLVAGQIAKRGVNVVVTTEPVFVTGDLPRLVEVFQNLVDNAVKYMGDQPLPKVEIGVEWKVDERVFYVRDNGIGIDPRHRHKLFGLFEKLTLGSNGTGMGLALVKRIVEIHGGRVWVESEGVGKGSCFRFTLPGCGD